MFVRLDYWTKILLRVENCYFKYSFSPLTTKILCLVYRLLFGFANNILKFSFPGEKCNGAADEGSYR